MKKAFFLFTALFLIFSGFSQIKKPVKLNFDFEQNEKGKPAGWNNYGSSDYLIYLDSTTVKTGKYSVVIEFPSEAEVNFKALALTLPENYAGKKITLSGHIKTENVSDGHAGLWMRIDPQIAFDNMQTRGIVGTTDWQKYEITLTLNPAKTQQIVIGGLLVGKGKMWLDDLQVTIDGKDIKEAKPFKGKLSPSEKDKEFDNGSTISFPELNEQSIADLELLGRLWGFLKYHHPKIAQGNYNWDYELFRILPEYSKAENIVKRDQILLRWIKKLGKIPACTTCQSTPDNAYLKPDLSWIDNSNMNAELQKELQEIYQNRHQGEHHYIGMYPFVGNPEFKNENPYSNMLLPDVGFRLLSLYRYWNMIYYFFPNTYMTDKDWDSVLKEYIPIFISAKNRLQYEQAAILLIGKIHDTHANLWGGRQAIDQSRGNLFAPFHVRFIENQLVITDYYNPELIDTTKLQIGDVITHINGKTIESIVDSVKKYYPASNEAARMRDIAPNILRSKKENITIDYLSSGQKKQIELSLYKASELNMFHWYKINKDEKCYKFLNDSIGYITLATITNEDIPNIKQEFENTKGIIIDIRNYPSTFVPFSLGSYFVSAPTVFAKFTMGNINNPGEFVFRIGDEIPKDKKTYQGKLVVLVNELTQSQAEYTAMAFKAGDNTTILGSTTAGADGNVSTIFLPGGLRTMISGIGVYYPDGTPTQRIGIVPDIEVNPTIKGIKNRQDELLEKAIEVINNSK